MVSVAIVDNHEAIRRGIEALFAHSPEFWVVASVDEPSSLLAGGVKADVVVLDLWLGRDDVDSLDAIEPLRAAGSKVLLHTSEERPVKLRRAVALGALGVALKNDTSDAFLTTLRSVAAGEFHCSSELAAALVLEDHNRPNLARREIEVLECLADGLTREQVAARLGLNPGTVKTYLSRVRDKYLAVGREVTNATSLILEAGKDGYTRLH